MHDSLMARALRAEQTARRHATYVLAISVLLGMSLAVLGFLAGLMFHLVTGPDQAPIHSGYRNTSPPIEAPQGPEKHLPPRVDEGGTETTGGQAGGKDTDRIAPQSSLPTHRPDMTLADLIPPFIPQATPFLIDRPVIAVPGPDTPRPAASTTAAQAEAPTGHT